MFFPENVLEVCSTACLDLDKNLRKNASLPLSTGGGTVAIYEESLKKLQLFTKFSGDL